MKPVALFGSGIRSISDIVTRQRRVNCFYLSRDDADRSSIIVLGTPGSSIQVTLPTAPIYGMHPAGDFLYVVAGTVLYSVTSGGGYVVAGNLPTTKVNVGMADNGVDLTIVDGVSGYVLNLSTHVFSTIVDVNFPAGCTTICYNGERYVVESPNSRQFVLSAQLDGKTWTPYIFDTKEDYSDTLIAMDSYNGVLIAWGQPLSVEFWQNAGTSPSPFQKISGATLTWGLAAKNSRCLVGNTYFYLGQDQSGGFEVMQLVGTTPRVVSTDDVEDIIRNLPVVRDAIALTYSANGHRMYQLTFPSANRTLTYDTHTNVWHEAQTGNLGTTARHFGNIGAAFNGKSYFSDGTSGNLYTFDLNSYSDAGEPILREVCTKHVRNAGNELSISNLYLDMEVGVGNAAAPAPQVMVSVSKDGGKTFGPEKWRSMGKIGEYRKRVNFTRLGSSKDFVFKIRVTDPVKFLIASGSATVEDDTND